MCVSELVSVVTSPGLCFLDLRGWHHILIDHPFVAMEMQKPTATSRRDEKRIFFKKCIVFSYKHGDQTLT